MEKTPAQVAAMTAQGTYAAYLHSEILRVVPTYVALGIAVLVLATCIGLARFPANLDAGMDAPGEVSKTPVPQNKGSMGRLLRTPHLMFAVVAQFFYVGAQVSTWSTYIPYMRAYTSVSEKTSGYFLTGTLAAFALGRIVSTPLMRYIAPGLMMGFYAIINLVLMVASVLHPGMFGAYAILVSSFFMSVMYPTIFALGVKDLGADTKLGGSLVVMSIVSGALFPPLMGWVARLTGSIADGYVLPAIGYGVVALYAFLAPRVSKSMVGRGQRMLYEGS
jgi:FHS family L-fucose permease-like MFS transporter